MIFKISGSLRLKILDSASGGLEGTGVLKETELPPASLFQLEDRNRDSLPGQFEYPPIIALDRFCRNSVVKFSMTGWADNDELAWTQASWKLFSEMKEMVDFAIASAIAHQESFEATYLAGRAQPVL